MQLFLDEFIIANFKLLAGGALCKEGLKRQKNVA
jgi:hypothetical protein